MTRALGIRSTGAPTKRQQRRDRAAFKELKERVREARRVHNREQGARHRARVKVGRKQLDPLAEVKPLTAREFEASSQKWRAAAVELGLWTPVPEGLEEIW